MKKKSGTGHGEGSPLFPMLLNLPAILFLTSMARGIWHYRLLPDVVPPLLPVLWPFSQPLPGFYYILLPLGAGAFLVGSRVWSHRKGGSHLPIWGEAASKEAFSLRRRQGRVERLRQLVGHPVVVSFLLQAIVVASYSYIQERLLTDLTGGIGVSSALSLFYGWVLALFLTVFLFSIMIRMYRKENPPD